MVNSWKTQWLVCMEAITWSSMFPKLVDWAKIFWVKSIFTRNNFAFWQNSKTLHVKLFERIDKNKRYVLRKLKYGQQCSHSLPEKVWRKKKNSPITRFWAFSPSLKIRLNYFPLIRCSLTCSSMVWEMIKNSQDKILKWSLLTINSRES